MRWTEEQLAAHLAKTGVRGGEVKPVDQSDPPFACPPDAPAGPVTITLAGEPQGKGRARAFRRGNFIGHYTPEKTRSYEGMIRTAAMDAMGDGVPLDEPVELTMRAVFGVPASWSRRKRDAALCGQIRPAKKPDYDNIIKAWSDALNGVVYRDDALIVRVEFEKRYGPAPLVVATVRAVATPAPARTPVSMVSQ